MKPSKLEINNKFYSKIYILESPSSSEISSGINEGIALSSVLNLANLDNSYYLIDNKSTFQNTIDIIGDDINLRKNEKIPNPFLHFSLHGNKNGIAFSNENFLDWNQLREILMNLNKKVGFTTFDNKFLLSRFCLSMSVCKGIYAYKTFRSNKLNPYYSLIGPKTNISWSDSLVAFITLYHHLIYKRSTIIDSIDRMNIASGLTDVFKNFLDDRLIL